MTGIGSDLDLTLLRARNIEGIPNVVCQAVQPVPGVLVPDRFGDRGKLLVRGLVPRVNLGGSAEHGPSIAQGLDDLSASDRKCCELISIVDQDGKDSSEPSTTTSGSGDQRYQRASVGPGLNGAVVAEFNRLDQDRKPESLWWAGNYTSSS